MTDSSQSLSDNIYIEVKWERILAMIAELGAVEYRRQDYKPEDDSDILDSFQDAFLEGLADMEPEEIQQKLNADFEDLWIDRHEVTIYVREDN